MLKTLLSGIAAALIALACPALADSRLVDLPSVGALNGSEFLYGVQGRNDSKITTNQLLNFMQGNIQLPNLQGVATPGQLPLPTAGTIGGVKAAASVAGKVQMGIDTSGNPILAPAPAYNVLAFGADNTGANPTQTTAAFTTIINNNPSGNIRLFLPCGSYQYGILPEITASNVTIEGEGEGCVFMGSNSTTGQTPLVMGGKFNSLKNITLKPFARSTAYQVSFQDNAFECLMRDVNVWYGGGINYTGSANTCSFENISIRNMIGTIGLNIIGTSTAHAIGPVIRNLAFDADWPAGYPQAAGAGSNLKTWSSGQAMNPADVVDTNGAFYQTAQACTTGSSAPSGMPAGTTPDSVFTGTVPDGTCNWRWVSNDNLTCIISDSYSYSLLVADSTCINGANGYIARDTAAATQSYPAYNRFNDFSTDSQYSTGLQLLAGFDFRFVNGYHASSKRGYGILAGPSYRGGLTIGGSRISGNFLAGVRLAGGIDLNVSNNSIGSNAVGGVDHSVEVAAGVSKWIVNNNWLGADAEIGIAAASNGLNVATGASDYYVATGNLCAGGTTGPCVADGGTGTHKTVSGNW